MPEFDSNKIVNPTYSIYQYTSQIYKIIRFKSAYKSLVLSKGENKHYDKKLDCSLSRSRSLLLAKALCNKWDWFCTFTIDQTKYDRYSLNTWYKDFSQFIRDERKRGYSIRYLFVPEMHKDGAWHLHGFMSGDMELQSFLEYRKAGNKVKQSLIDHGFYNWPSYQKKFGFCSFGPIRSPVRSAFYISKYITKDNSRLVTDLGAKMFYSSVGLNVAAKAGDIYGDSSYLNEYLTQDYEFCKIGMTKVSDNLDWTFSGDLFDIPFESFSLLFDQSATKNFISDMTRLQYDQLNFDI